MNIIDIAIAFIIGLVGLFLIAALAFGGVGWFLKWRFERAYRKATTEQRLAFHCQQMAEALRNKK